MDRVSKTVKEDYQLRDVDIVTVCLEGDKGITTPYHTENQTV